MSGAFEVTGIQRPAKKWVEDFGEGWVHFKTKGHEKHDMILAHVGPEDPKLFWDDIHEKMTVTFGVTSFHAYYDCGYLILVVNIWTHETPRVFQPCNKLSYLQKRMVLEVLFEHKAIWRERYWV